MIAIKELQNKPVISLTDGKKLGEIKDLYLDNEVTRVAAIFLGREGLISRKTTLIESALIQVYGVDAWLVKGSDVAMELPEDASASAYLPAANLRGHEITTEGGTKIGAVGDVLLDREGRVLGFALGKVHVQGPLAEKGHIAREAVIGVGSKDQPMLVDLSQAETLTLTAEAGATSSAPAQAVREDTS